MANRVVLTVADHEQNGFVALAKWSGLAYGSAIAFIAATDALISDDEEPDGSDAAFTFILDLVDERTGDLLDTGKRLLPTQVAMSLAPEQVRQWIDERPEPDSVMDRYIPEASGRTALEDKP